MTELIIQQTIDSACLKKNRSSRNERQVFASSFLNVVSQCIQINNSIFTDYGIDILETNGSSTITNDVVHRLHSLSSLYFQSLNQNTNCNHNMFCQTSQHRNNNNEMKGKQSYSVDIHYVSIRLPARIEMQLRNNRLLQETIHSYRREKKLSKVNKRSTLKPPNDKDEEDLLAIDVESICPVESDDDQTSSLSNTDWNSKENLIDLMRQIYDRCKNQSNQNDDKFLANIKKILSKIIDDEVIYESSQNDTHFNKQRRQKKTTSGGILEILPYENTYGQFYHSNQFSSIESTMIEKIIQGVHAMIATLTNSKDAKDVLNGLIITTDPSSPLNSHLNIKLTDELVKTLQKRFMTRKQLYTSNNERRNIRMAIDLVLADYRLNGLTNLCRSDSILLSCKIRKILKCTQTRTLCSYADILTTLNESNSTTQIHFRTITRVCLSSDEFIEILGEMYQTCYATMETLKYYLEASDIIDTETNLIHSSVSTSKQLDELMKYILYEDAIRLVCKFISDQQRNNINDEDKQLTLILPAKLNDLYQPIKKLSAFMSTTEVLTAIRKPYLSQLNQRAKTKTITVNDLRAITSHIWLSAEDFQSVITTHAVSSDIICQFYIDFHEKDDIDERLDRITRKIHEHLNSHSCMSRIVFKMIAERSNGTSLIPFLDEFNRTPRFISIIDIYDELLASGLISISELLVQAKQEIVIKKSSLLKHFQHISFIRKHDAESLTEMTLVIREDLLIEFLVQRAQAIREAYIDCIVNNAERRDFITKNTMKSTKRLSSLSIHEFIRCFHLNPSCGKIFYWMNLIDENIVKILIETKTFVNEYTLNGVYQSFQTRLQDTLDSGSSYICVENAVHSIDLKTLCQLKCYLTYEQSSNLVDFADLEYIENLSSLVVIQDVVSYENMKSLLESDGSRPPTYEQISKLIRPKQQVIECRTLHDSFRQRIHFRQKRFERVQNLQKLLLSPALFDQFIELIPISGEEYFARIELDRLEDMKLIDLGVLALLLTLHPYNSLIHQHKYEWFRDQDSRSSSSSSVNKSSYLHILDPIIEKYSVFLTINLIKIISNKDRFSTVNEILLSDPEHYLSVEEVWKICVYEKLLSYDDALRICQETFPNSQTTNANELSENGQIPSIDSSSQLNKTSPTEWSVLDSYNQHIARYSDDAILQAKLNRTMFLAIFDYLLHLNHRVTINGYLQQLFHSFKPITIHNAQLLIEKEMAIIKLLLHTRQQQVKLNINDLNRYLESYPIPCRLDIANDLRRSNMISQSLADQYTLMQCYELKSAIPEIQTNFLFYMLIKLIREEGYMDEECVKKILQQSKTDANEKKLNKSLLRHGFLTIEQLSQSTKDFFLQDYFDELNLVAEHKPVISKSALLDLFHRAIRLESTLMENMRRRQVIQLSTIINLLKHAKINKEKVQRKVDNVLSKMDENTHLSSKMARSTFNRMTKRRSSIQNELHPSTNTTHESLLNLRSLRHHYIQAKIPRNQLHLLVEQGSWSEQIHLEFKHELDIIDADNSLDLIRYMIKSISSLIEENGSVGEKPLMKHFQQHEILFTADFDLLLMRYGMVTLEDLIDLFVVSRLAKPDDIKSYARRIFCLNVKTFVDISKSHEDILVKKNDVENKLEKRWCLTANDLSQLLNDVLKLDRLKRILDMISNIKTYIRLHPINTFNAVKALKLEFDFNHSDMKFLRDLKLLNDVWYKRYLLSRISETNVNISTVADEEQDQNDQQEFRFRSSADDKFDFDSFNKLLDGRETQSTMSDQRKQAYLQQLKKRKDQLTSYRAKLSIDEDRLQLSLDLDELQKEEKKNDRPRVIEQFFLNASTGGAQLLLPFLSDDQQRVFMQLDFASERCVEDFYKISEESEVKPSTHNDLVEEESTILSDEKHIKISMKEDVDDQSLTPSKNQAFVVEQRDQVQKTEQVIVPASIDKSSSRTKESLLANSVADEKEENLQLEALPEASVSTQRFISPKITESSHELVVEQSETLSDSTHATLCLTEDLCTTLYQSFEEMSAVEKTSLRKQLQLVRYKVDQWLDSILQHNKQLQSLHNSNQSLNQHTTQLIDYFHKELNLFNENLISSMLSNSLAESKIKQLVQQRTHQMENVLQEMKDHQDMLRDIHQQIVDVDQTIHDDSNKSNLFKDLTLRFSTSKEDFERIRKSEVNDVQPIFRTRLELAIRTLDADVELIERIFDGKSPINTDLNTSLIATNGCKLPAQSIELRTHENMILIRNDLAELIKNITTRRMTVDKNQALQDLFQIDTAERLRVIRQEYAEQEIHKAKVQNLDTKLDDLVAINQELDIQSIEIRNHLQNIMTMRLNSNHSSLPLNAILKVFPMNQLGRPIEQPACLVDEQDVPLSDPVHFIRLPQDTDRFQISNDMYELTIVDEHNVSICDPITFKRFTSELITFEYSDSDRRVVEVSAHSFTVKIISLRLRLVPFDQLPETEQPTSQSLFVTDKRNQLLSKPIQLTDDISTSLNVSEFKLVTFLIDEKTNNQVLLTPEQYLITSQQAEFTSRYFVTYLTDQDDRLISESVQTSDFTMQTINAIEDTVLKRLVQYDRTRHHLFDSTVSATDSQELLATISNELHFMHTYIEDRMNKLKIEEKIIEQILPILDERYNIISTDHIEYKQQQVQMDYLLNTMKSIVHLDEKLTTARKNKAAGSLEVETLENHLIQQLIQISDDLNDQSIVEEVQNLSQHFHKTPLLIELRRLVLSGIKTHAKAIQKRCETLLMKIHQKSNQSKQPDQIRTEYIQYLTKQLNRERTRENEIEQLYEKIERMQYDLYQKIGTMEFCMSYKKNHLDIFIVLTVDSEDTIELEDLDNVVKTMYNPDRIVVSSYVQTKNEKLIYRFHHTLRYLHDQCKMVERNKDVFLHEMQRFLLDTNANEYSYFYQINFALNEKKIHSHQKLLAYIEKIKILLNKLETLSDTTVQRDFLLTKLERLYEILRENYQIELPSATDMESLRLTLNTIRKTTEKEVQQLIGTKTDLSRKLDVFNKKEELIQRTKPVEIIPEEQLIILDTFTHQSTIEPFNLRHEFYSTRIEHVANFLKRGLFDPSALNRTLQYLEYYAKSLKEVKIDNENDLKNITEQLFNTRKYSVVDSLVREQVEDLAEQENRVTRCQQSIIRIQTMIDEVIEHLRTLLSSNTEPRTYPLSLVELKQKAIESIIQSNEYERLSKRVSPNLLLLHEITSGQQLISLTAPSLLNHFQLGIKCMIHQELSSQVFLLRRQSSAFRKDYTEQLSSLDPTDTTVQTIRTEITYLQRKYDEAVAVGDISQQLAAKQIISAKMQDNSELFKTKLSKTTEQLPVDSQKIMEYLKSDTSTTSITTNEQSLPSAQIDERIDELLANQIKTIHELILTNAEQNEQHSVTDLQQLSDDLKRFREENNRHREIDAQLQILDNIEQLDHDTNTRNVVENLRKHLLNEQQLSFAVKLTEQSHHNAPIQIVPTLSNVIESTRSVMINDSLEPTDKPLSSMNANELYQELQQLKYSIASAFDHELTTSITPDIKSSSAVPLALTVDMTIEDSEEHVQSDDVHVVRIPSQNRLQSGSMQSFRSSFQTSKPTQDSTNDLTAVGRRTSLSIVGNARKYSIEQQKSKQRQIANSTHRSVRQSERQYGEVYVRHQLPEDKPFLDSHRDIHSKLYDKVKKKTRLVKFERTIKGNTVIHRQVNLPMTVSLVPQRAVYEENLQPAPPLIHVKDIPDHSIKKVASDSKSIERLFSISASSTSLSKTDSEQKIPDFNDFDYLHETSDTPSSYHSATALSLIAEVSEEVELSDQIPFKSALEDSSMKIDTVAAEDTINEFHGSNTEQKLDATLKVTPSNVSPVTSHIHTQQSEMLKNQVKPTENIVTKTMSFFFHTKIKMTTSPTVLEDLPRAVIAKKPKPSAPTKRKSTKKKPSERKSKLNTTIPVEDNQLMPIQPTIDDDTLFAQDLDVEPENVLPPPVILESKVVYHKVDGRLKRNKKKEKRSSSRDRTKMKSNKNEPLVQSAPLVLMPRKAVPFISATEGKQIDVEDDLPMKSRKKKRKRSSKSNRRHTRSRSSSKKKKLSGENKKKKKSRSRSKKQLKIEENIDHVSIEPQMITNKDALAKHLLDVKRFTGPPVSALTSDTTHNDSKDTRKHSRLKLLKPMIKNFELDTNSHRYISEVHEVDAYDLDKELFDFNKDTVDVNQPAMFTEYIPELFQKQAEEKQIRRISLTAIKTDESLVKRLAPRVSRLYNGWQPSNTPSVHTQEFHPLRKYLMSNLSYYFDEEFVDESGLFQNPKSSDKTQTRIKQATQRFRDDYIIKEFFHCWKDYTTEKARIAELRRKRVLIDFREFWFQDALSDPFYSYFQQPSDYVKKLDQQHQMAYRLHKRLVRTGREQPKETMKHTNRPSFLPYLFNLPQNDLDRQISLTHRRVQLINSADGDDNIQLLPLSNLLASQDEVLSLIRERIHLYNRTKSSMDIHRDELAIKQLLINSSLLKQGTIKDLDRLIIDYYTSLENYEIKTLRKISNQSVKLPPLTAAK
ncbi:unnamed protein product [Adineta ricciae]|uniref:Uncharacterized protein n=1 Tax=Adineta ricciae TaxID=249248 RepID=A0A814B2C9_ADIRI|nr:unnamed protein product [Adineta ricciae]CAF1015307.1 unnamed protein product [Adineta ricciae]